PVVRLNRLAPDGVDLYAKVEAFNPGGSVKDRLALAIILDAESRGLLKPGDTVVEATSGNTGVALAMVCAARGYKFVAVMTETFSVERRKLMRAYGAKVILTPAAERGTGMVRKAAELAAQKGWFLASQFALPAQHHRGGNPAGLRRPPAGPLRQRLGHRRHPDRRRADAEDRASGGAGHRMRAGGRRDDVRQGMEPTQDPGLDPGLPARGAGPRRGRPDPCGRRRAGPRHRAAPGSRGRHLLRHLRRCHGRRGAGSGQVRGTGRGDPG